MGRGRGSASSDPKRKKRELSSGRGQAGEKELVRRGSVLPGFTEGKKREAGIRQFKIFQANKS